MALRHPDFCTIITALFPNSTPYDEIARAKVGMTNRDVAFDIEPDTVVGIVDGRYTVQNVLGETWFPKHIEGVIVAVRLSIKSVQDYNEEAGHEAQA